jgi:hypothetical protein
VIRAESEDFVMRIVMRIGRPGRAHFFERSDVLIRNVRQVGHVHGRTLCGRRKIVVCRPGLHGCELHEVGE